MPIGNPRQVHKARFMVQEKMLVEKTEYLTAGVHIGMKSCTPYMKQFVYKVRDDGLAVFNLKLVDERIKNAANFLAGFKNILIVSKKENAAQGVKTFAEAVKGKAVSGRFPPGTLTNPSYKDFYEPDIILVVDPMVDEQAVREAKKKKIPIVALCDTFNMVKDIDLVIPMNNNGRKALALVFWILAMEVLKKRGDKTKFKLKVKDFGE